MNSLVQQDYAHRAPLKVFVADAHSTDDTAEIARSFSDRLDIAVIDGGIPSVGRNRGARCSDSEFVLFLDADVELRDPTLLRRALLRMKSQRLHCMTVDITCADGNWKDRFLYRANSYMQRLSAWGMPFGTGMFLLFDRKRFVELGGFDENALFAEDFLLTKQISPLRFSVLQGEVHTSNRRFRRTGHARMVFLFFWTLLNSSNRSHFERDHGYWKEAPVSAE
ncbi:Glycosyl transferase family 2 [Terriglobus roseus]|uniref:Glycosyl transferase family 2 n=1 Tax=Terriglobus roseus TaxID=392734 RepID=A0A1H4L4A1_9BACT|nr:Glycosyl transferase family 2 [Terriglobus roseus]